MMKKTAVFYGSTTGTCESLAGRIADKMGVPESNVHSADKLHSGLIDSFDLLIVGTSTCGDGDLQYDWYDVISVLQSADFSGESIALFGCGDSESYSDTFCDGIGILYEDLKSSGCTFIGDNVNPDGYTFSASTAVVDGVFVGLPLDDVNECAKTDARIDAWTAALKSAI